MKRKLAIMLAMVLMLGVTGCDKEGVKKPTSSDEETNQAIESEEAEDAEEDVDEDEKESAEETKEDSKEDKEDNSIESAITITYDGKNDDRYNDNGDLILYVYYVHPVVTVKDNEEASEAILAEFESDEEDFYITCDSMESEARLAFEDGMMEDMPAYANEVRFTEKRADNKVVSFVRSNYSHMGGAHGNNYSFGWNFDVETGKRLTLADITKDEEAFMAQVKDYVLELCETDAYKNRLFPEYKDSIDFVLQDDLWYFDYEGITFISNPYELSAYAEGTLYFTVPYEMLEGLKEEYTYDGGFQTGINLGESISIDLNGDGKTDEITFDAEEASDYTYVPKLIINDADYSSVFEDNQCYFAYPYEEYVILDIDSSDDYMEIAVQDYGMSDDPATMFFRYNGNEVIYMGYVSDRVSDLYTRSDGKGVLYARERMSIFETVNMKTSYEIEDDKLVQCMTDLYPIAYTDASSEKGLLQDLYVFTEMSTDSEVVKLDKHTEVIALATDNAEWVQIQYCEDGEIYYVHVVNHYLIDMNGKEVDSRDVFTDIIQAG